MNNHQKLPSTTNRQCQEWKKRWKTKMKNDKHSNAIPYVGRHTNLNTKGLQPV